MKAQIKSIFRYLGFDIISNYQAERKDAFFQIKKILNSPLEKTIFDVGAATGEFSIIFNNLFRKTNIYAFEPQSEYFEHIQKNHIQICLPFKVALSDEVGESPFFLTKSKPSSSLIKPANTKTSIDSYTELNSQININTTTIDVFCQENNIHQINLLKLDTQGSELSILKGASKMLQNNLIDVIYTEVEFIEIYENQPLFNDLTDYLLKYDYKLYNIYNHVYINNAILA